MRSAGIRTFQQDRQPKVRMRAHCGVGGVISPGDGLLMNGRSSSLRKERARPSGVLHNITTPRWMTDPFLRFHLSWAAAVSARPTARPRVHRSIPRAGRKKRARTGPDRRISTKANGTNNKQTIQTIRNISVVVVLLRDRNARPTRTGLAVVVVVFPPPRDESFGCNYFSFWEKKRGTQGGVVFFNNLGAV